MKKIIALILVSVCCFCGCDSMSMGAFNTEATLSNTESALPDGELSPTPYIELNAFDAKMTAHFGESKPELNQIYHGRKYDNKGTYDFGDYTVHIWVGSLDKVPRTLYLEIAETKETKDSFLRHAKEIFSVLLGGISDEEFQTIFEYADGVYVLEDPGFAGKLSLITGVMYYEQKDTSTTTLYTIKCTYKEN